MAKEIERKFLVNPAIAAVLKKKHKGKAIKQGYIATADNTAVRVRVSENQAYLTVKGENTGISRVEFEYEIPLRDAEYMLTELCTDGVVKKTRYPVKYGGHLWEIDVFHGNNNGLVVAEIELQSEDEFFPKPDWIKKEVSNDSRYYNSNLLKHPYKAWSSTGR